MFYLVIIHVDTLELKVRITVIGTSWINTCTSIVNAIKTQRQSNHMTPCSSEITSQNLAPIWFPHCPPWM